MDILDKIIYDTAEDGNGTVAYLQTKGNMHVIITVFPEHVIELFIIPMAEWKKIVKFFDKFDEDDENVDFDEKFWTKLSKFRIGEFSGNY